MAPDWSPHAGVGLAEIIASLSLATDLAVGQPAEHALRSCLLAVRLGETMGVPVPERREIFYVTLLQRIGCTADAFELSAWFADDLDAHARTFTLDFGRRTEVLVDLLRYAGATRAPLQRLRTLTGALASGSDAIGGLFRAACDAAQQLGGRLGLDPQIRQALGQVFERWDGRGWPSGARGEAIALSTRIARLTADAEVVHRLGGLDAALAAIRRRSGSTYDPDVAGCFVREAPALFAALEEGSVWEAALAAEPGTERRLASAELDDALRAMADFVDLKSPFFAGHSSGVARLAAAAAELARLTASDVETLRRTSLIHDLGRVGVSNGIWDKPGRLSDGDWERVRLHPYFTERILARAPALARLGAVAALHHERLDGSGYHRGAAGSALPLPARILAAADVYHAMVEPRPYRPPHSRSAAAKALREEVRVGRLDAVAVDAVLSAAGHRVRPRPTSPGGLSPREIEVLRLMARGSSNREIARTLGVSRHTASHHVRHIYDKIGASSRAGAVLFAVQHDLLDPLAET